MITIKIKKSQNLKSKKKVKILNQKNKYESKHRDSKKCSNFKFQNIKVTSFQRKVNWTWVHVVCTFISFRKFIYADYFTRLRDMTSPTKTSASSSQYLLTPPRALSQLFLTSPTSKGKGESHVGYLMMVGPVEISKRGEPFYLVQLQSV